MLIQETDKLPRADDKHLKFLTYFLTSSYFFLSFLLLFSGTPFSKIADKFRGPWTSSLNYPCYVVKVTVVVTFVIAMIII